jgi:hypothetical protein
MPSHAGRYGATRRRRFRKLGTQTGNELVPISRPDRPVLGDWRRIETARVIEDSALFGETSGRTGNARGERQGTADEVAPRRSDVTHGIPRRPAENASVREARTDARPVISNQQWSESVATNSAREGRASSVSLRGIGLTQPFPRQTATYPTKHSGKSQRALP